MNRRAVSATASAASLLVVGIIIGAALFYASFALAGRTLTTVTTSTVTSTVAVTASSTVMATSTVTATVPPPEAVVSVVGVYFPAVGTNGTITLFNSGSASTMVVSGSLSYSGQSCFLASGGSNMTVNPGPSTVTWAYTGGDACSLASNVSGVQFVGTLTFSSGAQVAFAGAFQ